MIYGLVHEQKKKKYEVQLSTFINVFTNNFFFLNLIFLFLDIFFTGFLPCCSTFLHDLGRLETFMLLKPSTCRGCVIPFIVLFLSVNQELKIFKPFGIWKGWIKFSFRFRSSTKKQQKRGIVIRLLASF